MPSELEFHGNCLQVSFYKTNYDWHYKKDTVVSQKKETKTVVFNMGENHNFRGNTKMRGQPIRLGQNIKGGFGNTNMNFSFEALAMYGGEDNS